MQAAFALFCLYSGWQFFWFSQWAMDRSLIFVERPPSVVRSPPECFGCLDCDAVCLRGNCLALEVVRRKRHPLRLPALVLATFLGFWPLALLASGHWHNRKRSQGTTSCGDQSGSLT